MSSKNELVSDHVKTFLTRLQTKTHQDKLFIGACTIELLRRAQQLDREAARSIVSFISRVYDVPWHDIPFSITTNFLVRGKELANQYGVSDKHAPDVLLSALASFSDLIADYMHDTEVTPEEFFEAIVAEEAEKFAQQQIASPAPAIYDHVMLRKCFNPAVTSHELLQSLGINYVTYRGMVGGVVGPILRGFAFSGVSDNWLLLLETGEFFSVSRNDPGLASCSADECLTACPALLAYTTTAAQELLGLGLLNDHAAAKIKSGALGEFTKPVHSMSAELPAIQALEQVLHPDADRVVTGPAGASVYFPAPLPDSKKCCVLSAMPAKNGAHVTAKLSEVLPGHEPKEQVTLYLNHPRYFSARGIYMFPTDNDVICLRVMV